MDKEDVVFAKTNLSIILEEYPKKINIILNY